MEASSRVAAAGLAALAVAMGIGRFAFTPLLPMMQDDAGVSLAQGGYLAAANYLGYLVGALWAVRRVRPHLAIRAALVAIVLSTLGMGLAHDFVSWLVLRFIAGVASAWALVYVSSWCLERLALLRRPTLNSVVFTGVGTGVLIAGVICLALMSAHASSSGAWIGLGALSLVVAAVVWPVLGVDGSDARPATQGGMRWTSDSLRLVLCYGAYGFGYIIPATFVPVMAKQVIADPRLFGWAWPIFGLTAAISTLLAGPLARAYGNRRVWSASAIAMALGVVSPVLFPGLGGILLAAVLVGATFVVITLLGVQEARRIAGDRAPPLVAAMTAGFALGQVAGPLSVTFVVERQGFAAALLFAALLLVLSAIALLKEKP
ncbi:MAG TPA: YbfB/YjiJ family MFS transporter [Burkholderiales bacterium]